MDGMTPGMRRDVIREELVTQAPILSEPDMSGEDIDGLSRAEVEVEGDANVEGDELMEDRGAGHADSYSLENSTQTPPPIPKATSQATEKRAPKTPLEPDFWKAVEKVSRAVN